MPISDLEIRQQLTRDNPWWSTGCVALEFAAKPKRHCFAALFERLRSRDRRAVLLLGQRRVGKSVVVLQLIDQLLSKSGARRGIAYLSLTAPLYTGMTLERVLHFIAAALGDEIDALQYVFFDDVQCLKDWERQLKSVVENYPQIRFVAISSVDLAGHGHRKKVADNFARLSVPALSFREFLEFCPNLRLRYQQFLSDPAVIQWQAFNQALLDYLNFGAYPEAAFSTETDGGLTHYLVGEVIEQTLLSELPKLPDISNAAALKQLFNTLARNSGQVLSIDALAKGCELDKPNMLRCVESLKSALLIGTMAGVDQFGRKPARVRSFKAFLSNPSMRAAMFGRVDASAQALRALTASAAYAQLTQAPCPEEWHFAHWQQAEVDFVRIDGSSLKPVEALAISFSDQLDPELLRLRALLANTDLKRAVLTSQSIEQTIVVDGVEIKVVPVAKLLLAQPSNLRGFDFA